MHHVQPTTAPITLPLNPGNSIVSSHESYLEKCPEHILATIYSYFDGQTLLTFRLVRKMPSEQETQYSKLLNLYFLLAIWDGNLEALNYSIFSAFDTIKPDGNKVTLDDLNKLALFFAEKQHPLKGLDLRNILMIDQLYHELCASGDAHPLLKLLPTLDHFYDTSGSPALSAFLKKTQALKTLIFSNARQMTRIIETFSAEDLHHSFQHLRDLKLKSTVISSLQISRLFKAIQAPLKSLDLSGWHPDECLTEYLEPKDFSRLFALLKDLNLQETAIQPASLVAILSACKSLTSLSLASCNLSDTINLLCSNTFTSTKRQEKLYPIFKSLRVLNLSSVSINSFCLQAILASCFALKELDLSCETICEAIKDLRLNQIPRIFSHIQKLSLKRTPASELTVLTRHDFHAHGLNVILSACQTLQHLDLGSCTTFPEIEPMHTPESLQRIFAPVHTLSISETNINAIFFEKLMLSCSSLRSLILSALNLTQIIEALPQETLSNLLKKIIYLDISYSPISNIAFVNLMKACSSLETLALNSSSECTKKLLKRTKGQWYHESASFKLKMSDIPPHLSHLTKE